MHFLIRGSLGGTAKQPGLGSEAALTPSWVKVCSWFLLERAIIVGEGRMKVSWKGGRVVGLWLVACEIIVPVLEESLLLTHFIPPVTETRTRRSHPFCRPAEGGHGSQYSMLHLCCL